MVPKPVVQPLVLTSPKFLTVCLQKSVVSVVLSKILARNVYVSKFLQFRRKCQQGQNFHLYVSKNLQFLQICQKSLHEVHVCLYILLFLPKIYSNVQGSKTCSLVKNASKANIRQHAASIYDFVCQLVSQFRLSKKKFKPLKLSQI